MNYFSGKNVLITGAASGIGSLLAEIIAKQGANLILWDVNQENLNAFGDKLKKEGQKVNLYFCDLSDRSAIYASAQRVIEDFGAIDILINNAGVVSGKTIIESKDEDIIRTFAVNTLALFWTTRAFLPGMIKRNTGHIVTIASAAGLVGSSRLVDYSSSKFGAVGYAESLRMELKRLGGDIETTLVCPYYVDTGMFKGVKTSIPFLLPILKPGYVAKKIVSAIQKKRKRLIMPRFILFSYLMRMLPTWIFDRVVNLFGINKTMDEFKGHGGQ